MATFQIGAGERELERGLWLRSGGAYRLEVPLLRLSDAKWSRERANAGEAVDLEAKVENAPSGLAIELAVHRGDGSSPPEGPPVATLRARPQGTSLRLAWRVPLALVAGEAIRDIGDAPGPAQAPPAREREPLELCFVARAAGQEARSQALEVKRRLELDFDAAETGSRLAGAEYLLIFEDGTARRGKLDDGGKLTEEDCPPGGYSVALGGRRFLAPVRTTAGTPASR